MQVNILRLNERYAKDFHSLLTKPQLRPARAAAQASSSAPPKRMASAMSNRLSDFETPSPHARRERVSSKVQAAAAAAGSQLSSSSLSAIVDVEFELESRGGWLPLMPLMPYDSLKRGWSIAWQEIDFVVQSWMRQRRKRSTAADKTPPVAHQKFETARQKVG